ncbi:MAG TPA: DUF507 family protein [Aquifex aeolicus]|uniref:DUF507 family protein n=2 Tax=Aquifex aeolicus TaxID=63363 RepID=A0A7C5L6I8_AQUAO|nr:DUF507 family protein [Aquifex aeolicus]
MKLPERLVERIADRIVRELTQEKLIEAEDPELFRKKIVGVFRKAEEEEKELDERTKEILKEKMNLLEETNLDYRTAFKAVKAKLAEEMKININRRERMNQIANMIRDLIMQDETVEIYEDPPLIRKRVADILRDAVREEEEIERRVREKIRQQSRNILEGTPEWNLLYRRIYEDELRQRGLA